MARILVVDDHVQIVRLLKRELELEGYEVVSAATGEEALAQLRRAWPALVLLDVMLPGKDGIEVLREMKRDRALAAVPVILLTARDHPDDVTQGLLAGADWYMTKPFRTGDIAALVRRFLGAGPGPAPPPAAVGPLPLVEIDLFTMTTAESFDLAVRGCVVAGLGRLQAGLRRADAARAAGEPWADELVRRYEEVRVHYLARHGVGPA